MQHSEKKRNDLDDLRGLKGLQVVDVKEAYPNLRLSVCAHTAKNDIADFLDSLPVEFEFGFFDYFYPQISDPSAYVTAQKLDEGFLYYLANHGWSSDWQEISRDDLVEYIFKNREYNWEQCWIQRRSKIAVLGARP